MSNNMHESLTAEVEPFRDKSISWISQSHSFRDPIRPTYSDLGYFFSPADGIILYQREVGPDESIVEIKGRTYCLRDAMRDPHYDARSLVIGIFMTFFDVHINRIPYPGRLSYREADPITTYNHPMLALEKSILQDLHIATDSMEYLQYNQRVLNRIYSMDLAQPYYLLQIADQDIDRITPFVLRQNQLVAQGQRFSQVRYGSQVDLILPLSSEFDFETVQDTGDHVEAGIDPIVKLGDGAMR